MAKYVWRIVECLVAGLLGVVLAVIFEDILQEWKRYVILRFFPGSMVFEATAISGCSGGELSKLVRPARDAGMRIRDPERVEKALLCQKWRETDSPQRILDKMASRFDGCFERIREEGGETFALRLGHDALCQTDYVLDSRTNDWIRSPQPDTYLCVGPPPPGRRPTSRGLTRDCTPGELKRDSTNEDV
jgi:hypothetical protein